MGELAIILYLIGFAATVTGALDEPNLIGAPFWVPLAIGAAWPVLAVMVVAARLWGRARG